MTTLRPAGAADVPDILAIYAEEVRHGTASWELEPPDAAEMARRFAAVTDAGYPWFVAEHGGRFAGYSYASSFRPRPGYRFTCENSVYVASWARGRGIGRLLLGRVIEACTEQGFRQMLAVIGDSQNHGSIALHAACGFQRAGFFPAIGWKFDRWLDSVLMQRALGDGDTSPPG